MAIFLLERGFPLAFLYESWNNFVIRTRREKSYNFCRETPVKITVLSATNKNSSFFCKYVISTF